MENVGPLLGGHSGRGSMELVVTFAAMDLLPSDLWWVVVPGIGFGLLSFAATFYCAAIVATAFWSTLAESVANEKTCDAWGTGTILLILAPMVLLNPVGLLVVFFLGPVAWWCFRRGTRFGEEWWRRRRWRHFLGLSNDWERDDERKQRERES